MKNTCYFLPLHTYQEQIQEDGSADINHWTECRPGDLKDIEALKDYCEGEFSKDEYIVEIKNGLVFVINTLDIEDSYVYELSAYEDLEDEE